MEITGRRICLPLIPAGDLSSLFPCFHFLFAARSRCRFPFLRAKVSRRCGDVKAEPSFNERSPPIKSSCFTDVLQRILSVGALPYPLIVCPLLPSKRTRHTPSFERKKNVSTMKTERSYHSQNRFETKRRLLALPQKIVWIVVCVVALKAIGVSEELTAILMLFAFVYLIRATLQIAFRLLFFLIRWICIAAALAWIVCRLLL